MDFEKYLPKDMCSWIKMYYEKVSDITLISDRNMFITHDGYIYESPYFVTQNCLDSIVNVLCKGSLYANQNTLKSGFVTIEGGHRIGVIGSAVTENNQVTGMRNITAINMRISREIIGAADKLMPYVASDKRVNNTLIISPPSRGKTTLLRDMARQIGNKFRVGIVDERAEIADGKDVGKFTFTIKHIPKGVGIEILTRTMAPDVIFTDEISFSEERIIESSINAGVKLICTAHGFDERDLLRRGVLKNLINNNVFDNIIILSANGKIGTIEKIIQK